ncbi:MAG: VWA domain-containing protein [Gaiellales bacterium]
MASDALVRHVVTFGRVLREAGLEVGPGRVVDALRAIDAVDLSRQEDVFFALRQTLVARQDELDLFDRAFTAWFMRAPVMPLESRPTTELARRIGETPTSQAGAGEPDDGGGDPIELGASGHELLREKDFGEMTPDEFWLARRLISAIASSRPRRASRRRRRDLRGDRIDMRRLVRQSLRTGGDPVIRPLRARKQVPRKLVVLCDVSGSMDSYARALLLFLHAAVGSGPGVEVFAFGTQLTRLTSELGTRDPAVALERCREATHDWGSGTRIGESLAQFNAVYGKRALSRGAVVLIVSDGWEREGTELVAREMARLSRAAYAVVWVNPLKGDPRYQPLAGGMRAALPYVDRFISGHNVRSLEGLAAVLAGIERRHAPSSGGVAVAR